MNTNSFTVSWATIYDTTTGEIIGQTPWTGKGNWKPHKCHICTKTKEFDYREEYCRKHPHFLKLKNKI